MARVMNFALKSLVLLLQASALFAAEPVTNSIGMRLVPIAPGTFTMGQDGPPLEDYLRQKRLGEMYKDIDRIDFDEQPAHEVTITRPFLMGVTEVTVGQYRQFDPAFNTGDTLPDGHQKWFGDDNFRGVYFPPGPLPRVYDWRNGQKSTAAGLKQGEVIGIDHPESEQKLGGRGALRVTQKTPNAWGLHDMHGNLAEWCLDWHGPYEGGRQTDPLGRADGDCRVFRGGFHSSLIRFLRSANRGSWVQNSPSRRVGFRVVQAELPAGRPLPVAPPPLQAAAVSQARPARSPQAADIPFFAGPKPFVRIPEGTVGPVYSSQNHSPSLTECPNGDLLAVWFSTLAETDLTTSNAASRLRFGADEWEPASAFWDAMDVNDHAPKVWWDGRETNYHIVEGRQHGDIVVRRSADNGATWSKAEVMRAHDESSGKPSRTKEGVIAVPFDSAGLSISRDDGRTWTETGRHRRGSDEIRPGGEGPFKDRKGMTFRSTDGEYTGFGLFAAVSYDEGKTWPYRRLLAPPGKKVADSWGYLAVTQTRDGRIQLITSKDHYTFNLAWIKALPPATNR